MYLEGLSPNSLICFRLVLVINGDIAVSIQNVAKKYRLFSTPRERLKESLHPFRKRYHKEFWALKDISFDIAKGQAMGILGRNGSGKSTLLQIIASVLQPTCGTVIVRGRISALLELGTGFNPEFTGRQNVLLNGAIMGVPREKMVKRIPEIEAFAQIGDFFDQPMKIYSSGMFLRVAFAASIHSEPDVLVIDEALAVGDAKFQYRCFQKLREFQARGVTIILVTHAPELVVRHCDRAVLLEQGHLVVDDSPERVVRDYIDLLEHREPSSDHSKVGHVSLAPNPTSRQASLLTDGVAEAVQTFFADRPSVDQCFRRATYNTAEHVQNSHRAQILDHLIIAGDKVDPTQLMSGEEVDVYFKVRFADNIRRPCFGIALNSRDGVQIYALNSAWTNTESTPAQAGEIRVIRFRLVLAVNSGDLFLDVGIDELEDAARYINVCRRMGLIHLIIHSRERFHGLVDFRAIFCEKSVADGNGDPFHE
jgi:ABC-type polysaccharide/polyol phosphate transport system ATPase subunit